jgi:hypothetical protein
MTDLPSAQRECKTVAPEFPVGEVQAEEFRAPE